jgi:hypothetical protein
VDKECCPARIATQSTRSTQVTNLRHEFITVDDDMRRLLALLDGSRGESELAALAWPGEAAGTATDRVRSTLTRIARQALLVR